MPTGAAVPTGPKIGSSGATVLTVRTRVVTDKQTQGFTGFEGNPAAGQAVVTIGPVPSGSGYEIERLDLYSDSSSGSTVNIYVGPNIAPQNEVDYSLNGGHDVGDLNQPIYVPSGSYLTLLWSGLSTGARVTAHAQWSVVQFVARSYA